MLLALLLGCPPPAIADTDGTGTAADCVALSRYAVDADGDGYGDPDTLVLTCDAPPGYVADESDCNVTDPTSYPGAPDVCATPGVDEDCAGGDDVPTAAATTVEPVVQFESGYGSWGAVVLAVAGGGVLVSDPAPDDSDQGYVQRFGNDYAVNTTYEGGTEPGTFGALLAIGDVLPDGGDAVIVGDLDGGAGLGAVYVFDASAAGSLTTGEALYTVVPVDDHRWYGYAIDTGADVTGDGRTDLLVGFALTGLRVYADVAAAGDPATGFLIDSDDRDPGRARLVPDTDGDGIGELILGLDIDGGGALALYAGPILADLRLPDDAHLYVDGDAPGGFGTDAVVPGDLDGDGSDDLVVGAPDAMGRAGTLTFIPGGTRGQVRADSFPFVTGLVGNQLGRTLVSTHWGSDGVDLGVGLTAVEDGWGVFVYTCMAGRTSMLGAEDGIVTEEEPIGWDVAPDGSGLYVVADERGARGLYVLPGPGSP